MLNEHNVPPIPVLPKYEKLKKYTYILIPDDDVVVSTLSDCKDKLQSDFQFVPPVFSEYVITADLTRYYTKLVSDELYNYAMSRYHISEMTKVNDFVAKHREKLLQETYKGADLCRANLVRWYSERTFSVTCYDLEKKVLHIYASYEFDENGKASLSLATAPLCHEFSELYDNDIEHYRHECNQRVLWVLAVSKFLLEYTNKVQYETVEYKPHKAKSNSDSEKKSNVSNRQANNTIVLKSKIKKYLITGEDVAEIKKRKFTPKKSSWFVRGYYERFGKDKVLKYIPPRINKRNPELLTAETDSELVAPHYIIKK